MSAAVARILGWGLARLVALSLAEGGRPGSVPLD
jgi:hypothetical protein